MNKAYLLVLRLRDCHRLVGMRRHDADHNESLLFNGARIACVRACVRWNIFSYWRPVSFCVGLLATDPQGGRLDCVVASRATRYCVSLFVCLSVRLVASATACSAAEQPRRLYVTALVSGLIEI